MWHARCGMHHAHCRRKVVLRSQLTSTCRPLLASIAFSNSCLLQPLRVIHSHPHRRRCCCRCPQQQRMPKSTHDILFLQAIGRKKETCLTSVNIEPTRPPEAEMCVIERHSASLSKYCVLRPEHSFIISKPNFFFVSAF
jgi:hypothetical protein